MTLAEARRMLGVSSEASPEEVARAYKRRAVEMHPDRGGSTEGMVELNAAKAILDGKEAPLKDVREAPSPSSSWYARPSPEPEPYQRPEARPGNYERPKPVEDVVTFAEALAYAHVPHGVTWVLRADPAFGGYGDNSRTGDVIYGTTDTEHVFLAVEHHTDHNAYTNHKVNVWHMRVETYPRSEPLGRVASRVFREMFKAFQGLNKGYNGKAQILNADFKLDQHVFFGNASRSMALADALEQIDPSGASTTPAAKPGKKLQVTMILGKTRDFTRHTVTLVVNGREFELTPESAEKISGQTRMLTAVFGTYYYWSGDKKDLTRSKSGKSVLMWLSTQLAAEPPELLELLRIAAEQMKA